MATAGNSLHPFLCTGDDTGDACGAGFRGLRVARGSCPAWWRSSGGGRCYGDVLRGGESLGDAVSGEVRPGAVGRETLFVDGKIAKVGLHCGDIRLLPRIPEFRDGDGGKNADDDDDNQKLYECERLSFFHCATPLVR